MRHASSVGSVALLALASALAPGCSCSGSRPASHHDSGAGHNPEDDASLTLADGQVVAPDAFFDIPDQGPRMDTGCGATTPVMNEIIGDPPDMLILLDLSGSMCEPVGLVGMTKLAVMKSSLTTLTSTFDARINWGLMRFPEMGNQCGPGHLECPIAPHNAAMIGSTLAGYRCPFTADGSTPTFLGVDSARTYFDSIPVNPVGRYVLLATDGEPNCGAPTDDAGTTAPTVDETVAAIQRLHDDGVTTYVLGFGGGFSSDMTALNRMAVAGGTTTAFSARSASDLDMALDTIAAMIIPPTCTIMLDGSARDPSLFQVSFDGGATLIPRDTSHASGWDYDASTNTITFYGGECSAVESGSVANIDVQFGCPGPLI